MFLFLASSPCSAEPFVSAGNRVDYLFCRLGVCYYAWKSETHDYKKRIALHGQLVDVQSWDFSSGSTIA
jgi:hypothetical protein